MYVNGGMPVHVCTYLSTHYCMSVVVILHVCIPCCFSVCDICCDFNPFLLRQVITHSTMQVDANNRATTRNSIAIVLQAGCIAAASFVNN